MSQNRAWAFGEYRLDEQERQLRRGGQVVPLAPKLFDLLAELVRNAGHLLHKEQLLETIWPGVVVEEGTLTRGISSLRQALGPDAGGRDYIETVPKRGYRFTADVRQASTAYVSERAPLAGPPVPPALAAAIAGDFIGRENELIRIQEVWRTARLGHQQLVLIAGEPGVGKTRLSAEFASRCAAQGSAVLAGYCEEEHLVPYQPFIECLTWYFRHCPQAALKAQLAEIGGGGELAAFVPELRTRIPDLPQPVAIDPEGQRYRLFECVGAILSVVSAQRPTLLVFDDIHWADKATLLLVRHLLRSSRPGAFAIVATYRDSELGRTHPLSELLPDLRRETGVTRVALRGLKVEHVRRIVHGIIGPGAPSRLPQIVMDYTDGNPFFATEMLLHLKETGTVTRFNDPATDAADLPVSEGIKEVIGRRLSRLSDSCNRALSVAAVLGREFDVSLMESVADLSENALLDALEEATRAGVLSESSGLEGRFQFRHALIRETLYGELSSPRRARLHRRIGEALEASAREDPDSRLGELAYHFSEAASAGIADKAVDYAIRAGDHAADALAHEDAARLFEMALHSLEFRPAGRETARMRAELHSRRARSFDALGQWSPEIRELEAALEELGEEQSERRCECLLALARAWFLLLDVRPVERYATEGLQIAEAVHRPDLAANAVAWLARCHQANGDLGTAIEMDRRSLVMAPGIMTAADMMGPLTLYLAGRSREALTQAAAAAERARSSRDTTFVMYTLTHLGLNLTALGRYAEATGAFDDARSFGRKFGALPMLARATAMAAGLRLAVFDYDGAETLQAEACELARTAGFVAPVISAGIDSLLTFARRREPGRAERLLEETAAAAATTANWHQWLWQLRLTQARAELALARGAFADAAAMAADAIAQSRARVRPKYQALGLIVRARALAHLGKTREAIIHARTAVRVARQTADPALLLLGLDALITLDGSDDFASRARQVTRSMYDALPTADREMFAASEVVRRNRWVEPCGGPATAPGA